MQLRDGFARWIWHARRLVRRLESWKSGIVRRVRYGAVPAGGWGEGWRILVFRYTDRPDQDLHVLAPVKGLDFDWETMRPYTRGIVPWPAYDHEPGTRTGFMGWGGHHTFVITDTDPPQRLSMGKLIPGEFGGGVQRGFLMVEVRKTGLAVAKPVLPPCSSRDCAHSAAIIVEGALLCDEHGRAAHESISGTS